MQSIKINLFIFLKNINNNNYNFCLQIIFFKKVLIKIITELIYFSIKHLISYFSFVILSKVFFYLI